VERVVWVVECSIERRRPLLFAEAPGGDPREKGPKLPTLALELEDVNPRHRQVAPRNCEAAFKPSGCVVVPVLKGRCRRNGPLRLSEKKKIIDGRRLMSKGNCIFEGGDGQHTPKEKSVVLQAKGQ